MILRASALRTFLTAFVLIAAIAATVPASAQDLASFEERTTVHTLDNGWTFILVERPVAPVFSFATYVNVGSAQEVPGITGLAHMFEHMAFKGTDQIGTTDYEAELKAIDAVEEAYQALQAERHSQQPDEAKVEELEAAFEAAQEKAEEYVVPNQFGEIVDRAGGVFLNAFTNSDVTGYFYSLPANQVETFAYLESGRFLNPVYRQFYKERDVVQEERRLRTESQPVGRMIEQMLAAAFVAHPYRQPTVGYMSDLQSFTITDAKEFHSKYYVPGNMVTVVVGDIDREQMVPLLDTYFGRVPAGKMPPPLRTQEPAPIAEKVLTIPDPAQPFYAVGFHKPAVTHPDQPVFTAIDDILSNGRTSRLYRSLVQDKKIAVASASLSNFPGSKYPNLWIAYAIPAKDVSNEEVAAAIKDEIERLKTEPVSEAELQRFKTRAKASLIRSLGSNRGLANNLARYQTFFGDWRELFRYIDRLDAVTAEDVQRVARATFYDTNRIEAMIETETPEEPASTDAPSADNDSAEAGS